MAYLSNAILENPLAKPGKPRHNRKYLRWVAGKYCLFCGNPSGPPHHVRWAGECGLSRKPSDTYVIPVCHECHDAVHSMSGPRYRDVISKIGREEILSLMLDLADEWMKEKGV